MTVRVVHCKRDKYDIYIGRPSKWGNPIAVPKGYDRVADPLRILERYEAHVRSRPDLMAALPELRNKVLGCWCAPHRCHGDVLARLVAEHDRHVVHLATSPGRSVCRRYGPNEGLSDDVESVTCSVCKASADPSEEGRAMKVYVVCECLPYEGCEIRGVFATRELAEAYAASNLCRDGVEITEWEVHAASSGSSGSREG